LYGLCDKHNHAVAEDPKPVKVDLDKYVDRAIENLYAGKVALGQPDADLVRQTAEELWKAVKKGWNTNGEGIHYGTAEQRLLINMRYNTFVTSVFKHHHFALDMARELFDEKGTVRSFSEFKKAVKDKIDPKYNKNWLRTEYNTAYASGQMARKWQTFLRKGGFLTYVAVLDNRVRDDHRGMHGARYPVDHIFWKNHYPPNDYNCRCTVRWDGTEGETIPAQVIDEIPPFFQNNVGETGIVFKDSPYFTVDGAFSAAASKLFGLKPPVDPVKYQANLDLYNRLVEDKNFKLSFVDNLTGGFVFRHVKSGTAELAASKALARAGNSVVVREVVNAPGIRNADIIVNGVNAEVKTNKASSLNAIDTALREGKRQASVIVIDVTSSMKASRLEEAIYDRVRRSRSIERVVVIYKDVVYELSAQEILSRTFFGKIGK
jgi:SPP1 gp7 family putative phage head morphogenesis protein